VPVAIGAEVVIPVPANHRWSVGGSGSQNVSNTFLQPVMSYTTKDAWTFTLDAESTYDWLHSRWTAPINATAAELTRIGHDTAVSGVGVT